MQYKNIKKGNFIRRLSRFQALVRVDGADVNVHIKNTGRCVEQLAEENTVWVQPAANPQRETQWDLIAAEMDGRLVNIDSLAPNAAAGEWLRAGGLFPHPDLVQAEHTIDASRIDFYLENEGRKILLEVKGVTLTQDGGALFPDAPSKRAVKHVEELTAALGKGYEAYVLFVIPMKGMRYFAPNSELDPDFFVALKRAQTQGVHILAYDCLVTPDSMVIDRPLPVKLSERELIAMAEPLIGWYRANRRDLPWRQDPTPYHVWVSEIMLQQTRVETVKAYYKRFLAALPQIGDLAEAEEDRLLKLWEGLGYYNRVRNMQLAAQQVMSEYGGEFPAEYEQIRSLKGIGSYTAGAISAFAFHQPRPAIDGNVLRVIARVLMLDDDIAKEKTKKLVERKLADVIPVDDPSDFDQGLIELGATVCVPNGAPKCEACPLAELCRAKRHGKISEYPKKSGKKARRIEKKTVLVIKDGKRTAIGKRPAKGLLAGLYELPNTAGWLSQKQVDEWLKERGMQVLYIKEIGEAVHVFSHVEWHMRGYEVRVDELAESGSHAASGMIFADDAELKEKYPVPTAFKAFGKWLYE